MIPFLIAFWQKLVTVLLGNEKSLELDGVNQYVAIDGVATDMQSESSFSISFWAKSSAYSINPVAVTVNKNFAGATGIWIYPYQNIPNSFEVWFNGSTLISASTGATRENEWNFYTFVSRSSTDHEIYVNGASVGTSTASKSLASDINKAAIGGDPTNSQWYDGFLDQVCFWDKAITIAEMKEAITLRDMGQHSAYSNIISYYDFEDADISGSTLTDKGNNSNSGTLTNSPVNSSVIPFPYSYQLVDGLKNDDGTFDNAHPAQGFGGYSFDMDGVSEYITMGDVADFSPGNGTTDTAFSISSWIKINSYSSLFPIFSKAGNSGSNREYNLYVTTSGELQMNLFDDTVSHYRGTETGANSFDFDKWYHVAVTYDGTGGTNAADGLALYINGVSQSTSNISSGTYVAMHDLTVSCGIGFLSSIEGDGIYGDTMYLNKELSGAEIGSVFNNFQPRDEMQHSLSANIKGYWRAYNSTNTASGVLDQSGNGNHGTMTNMEAADIVYDYPRTTVSLQNDEEGCFDFDGTNQRVSVTDDNSLSFGNGTTDSPFSAAIWAKRDARGFRFITKGTGSTANEWRWEITTAGNYRLWIYDENTSNYIGRSYSTLEPVSDNWRLYSFTYDGSGTAAGISLYIDTTRVDDTTNDVGSYTAMHNTTGILYIGGLDIGSDWYSDGRIAQASVWGRALTLSEIQEIYNDGSPTDLNSHSGGAPVSWWKMDGSDSGSTATDSAGSNDGTYINAPTFSSTDYPTN